MTPRDRVLSPEWLDELPAADRMAVGSRRDLRRLNGFMGHARLVSRALLEAFPQHPPARLVELGAGDGAFLLRVAKLLAPRWPGVEVVLIDRRPAVDDETLRGFARLGWKAEVAAADVFDWLDGAPVVDAAVANLFLHHFDPAALRRLLMLLAGRVSALVACEPRRAAFPLTVSRLLWLLGCNAVTRHDAPISVRAGFRVGELSAQWPAQGWRLRERPAGLFSHFFAARRLP